MKYYIDTKKFLPGQLKWWHLDSFIKLLVGGYGSGKTHILAKRFIRNSYLNSGLPNQIVASTFASAKKTIIPTLEEQLDNAEIRYKYNKSEHTFYIYEWDGHIWIGSGEDPDSLKGPNLASGGIDEPFIQKEAVFKQMIARIRHPKATYRELAMTGTPEELNWGYSLSKNKDIDFSMVAADTRDNIHLPQEYIDNLNSIYSEEEKKALMGGKFINLTAGRVCKLFDEETHCIYRDDIDSLYETVPVEIGIDFNVDWFSVECFFDISGNVHFFKEFRKSNTDTYEMGDMIQSYFRDKTRMQIRIYPDATGSARKTSSTRSDHEILKGYGFKVITERANPPVRDRVNAWNKKLRDRSITIQKGECPYLVEDNEVMVWKNGDLDQKTDPKRVHAFDGGSYPIAYKYPIRNRIIRGIR